MPEVHVVPEAVSAENVDRMVNKALHQWRVQRAENRRRLHLSSRRLFKFEGFGGFCKATLMAGSLALFLLVWDGSCRDAGEFAVMVNSCDKGVKSFQTAGSSHDAATLAEKARLFVADGVQTPLGSEATLGFGDGSGIILGGKSRLDFSCLDFARDGRRDRSVFLHEGRAFVRVSPHFGTNRSLVCTPAGIIAAPSKSAFHVAFDAKTGRCDVDVLGGSVTVRTAAGRKEVNPGERAILYAASAKTGIAVLPRARSGKLSHEESLLNGAEDGDELAAHFAQMEKKNTRLKTLDQWGELGIVQKVERMVMKTLDPTLQKAGWTAHGFSLADNDAARRAQTAAQLTCLGEAFSEGENGDAPALLNPITLAPLGLSDKERAAILGAFAGGTIDEYHKTGDHNEFVLRVRARDRAGTQYELTGAGVREIGPSTIAAKN